ncbi:MAG: ribonuclease Z [Nitrospinae bacterium]|nr:ribonuclease Z [Nitrospinota bacterium]MBL7020627.1 ribonuclease Z [Nitrospinaceae bacterium]
MKSAIQPSLINDPFGDPGLLVQFLLQKRALLFDLGDLSAVSNGNLLKVSHVFVSHTHIDHFIGFDRLLRTLFGREKTLTIYGPKNIIQNVAGKLAGFTWNLVELYDESLTIEVVEVRESGLLKGTFRAIDRFQLCDERQEPFVDGLIVDDPAFSVRTAILEHRVPCLGFALEEKPHANIDKDKLASMKAEPGPWLNELKKSVLRGEAETSLITVPFKEADSSHTADIPLGQLKNDLVEVFPGQKIGYVVDTVFNDRNREKIVGLVDSADIFFCESPFLADEEERGRERCHLTSRQAGILAREAGVKQLQVFHFSSRHKGCREQFYNEAQEAFQG